MQALSIAILFLLVLAQAIFLVWSLRHTQSSLKAQEKRLSESLDDLDLVQFQESVADLLKELNRSGSSLLKQMEDSQKSLEKAVEKAREAEKKWSGQASSLEKRLTKAASLPPRARRKAEPARPAPQPPSGEPREGEEDPGRVFDFELAPSPVAPPVLEELPPSSASLSSLVKGQAVGPAPRPSRPRAMEPAGDEGAPSPEEARSARYRRVHELAAQGLDAAEIARSTSMLKGEVELVLRLKARRG